MNGTLDLKGYKATSKNERDQDRNALSNHYSGLTKEFLGPSMRIEITLVFFQISIHNSPISELQMFIYDDSNIRLRP